jgi:hypothetical protein
MLVANLLAHKDNWRTCYTLLNYLNSGDRIIEANVVLQKQDVFHV